MKYYLAHISINDGGTEYGNRTVCEAENEEAAREELMEEELEALGEDREDDIEIDLQEITREDYEVLRKYI